MQPSPDAAVLADPHRIESDPSMPEIQRLQLAKARIGQGFFRKQVILLDGARRVTGVSDTRVLIASHIKPWRDATNAERISGYNGMLLSPHVDALFDERLITFEDDGRMHVHPSLPDDVLDRWSIDPDRRVAPFRHEQRVFLAPSGVVCQQVGIGASASFVDGCLQQAVGHSIEGSIRPEVVTEKCTLTRVFDPGIPVFPRGPYNRLLLLIKQKIFHVTQMTSRPRE